jgi:TRAP-type C4-dicarboxylate transport system permease large subunit
VVKLGIDPLHFGLILVINLTVGGITPPVGTMMFTACTILGVRVERFVREGWPFILALFLVLALVTLVPQTVLWLPNLLMPQ